MRNHCAGLTGKVKLLLRKKGVKKKINLERGAQHFHGDKLRWRSANGGALCRAGRPMGGGVGVQAGLGAWHHHELPTWAAR